MIVQSRRDSYIIRLDEYIQFGCKIHIAVVEGKNYLQIFG